MFGFGKNRAAASSPTAGGRNPVWDHARNENTAFDGTGTNVAPDYSAVGTSAYAVQRLEDAPYNDEFGWAPQLGTGAQGYPDPLQMGTIPHVTQYPGDFQPPEIFYGRLDADTALRNAPTILDGNGMPEVKIAPGYNNPGALRFAPNPNEIPSPEPRWTQQQNPAAYSYWRPFGTNAPKQTEERFKGTHFSLADHRRTYPILGMEPARTYRNTYRVEPAPWDQDMIDLPPNLDNQPASRTQVTDPGRVTSGGSWRL